MSANLLDLIPIKIMKSKKNDDGTITVFKPKFRNKFMVKYLAPKLKSPDFKVKLDEFGSFVWKHCDGKTTVEQIGVFLKEKFKDNIDPVYDRLSFFIQSLFRYQFIEYKNYDTKQDKIIE